MNDESKIHARSLAENLELRVKQGMRDVAQRVLPEYFEGTEEKDLIQRAPQSVFRPISDTQSLRLSNDFYLLERRRRRLERELINLAKLYKKLRAEIMTEHQQILEEQDRLDKGIFYRIVEEEVVEDPQAERASAPTNLMGSSKDLP